MQAALGRQCVRLSEKVVQRLMKQECLVVAKPKRRRYGSYWSIGTRPDAELVNSMLDTAVDKVADSGNRPVVHSDRGAHYRWPGWLARIGNARLIRSMSRKGCSPDNAACEGFFGRLKAEWF